MSLLLDALKQAEENKKQAPEQDTADEPRNLSTEPSKPSKTVASDQPGIEISELRLTEADDAETRPEETAPNEKSNASKQETAPLEIKLKENPPASVEPAPVKEPITLSAKAPDSEPLKSTLAEPQPKPKPAPLDPALNVFAAGSKKPTKGGKNSRLWVLVLLLVLVLLGLITAYFWFTQQPQAASYTDDLYFEEDASIDVPGEQLALQSPAVSPVKQENTEVSPQTGANNTPDKIETSTTVPAKPVSSQVSPAEKSDNVQISITRSRPIEIKKRVLTLQQSDLLSRAYNALVVGDYNTAKQAYNQVIEESPKQIDALLGLAKINSHENKPQAARGLYEKVLQIDDSNTVAQLGLLHTFHEETDFEKIVVLQELSGKYPESSQIAVSLGQELAKQSKWADAQQAYFKAFSLSPTNAVYAYNLAVSLDRMEKYSAAKQYYLKALTLNEATPSALNTNSITQRLLQLGE